MSVEISESGLAGLAQSVRGVTLTGMTTVEKILRLIELRGLKQSHVERAAGLPVNRISKWREHGEPTASQLWWLAKTLDVPVSYLVDPNQVEPPSPPVPGEEAVLEVYKALHGQGVTAHEAIARLMRPDPAPQNSHPRVAEPLAARAIVTARENESLKRR